MITVFQGGSESLFYAIVLFGPEIKTEVRFGLAIHRDLKVFLIIPKFRTRRSIICVQGTLQMSNAISSLKGNEF